MPAELLDRILPGGGGLDLEPQPAEVFGADPEDQRLVVHEQHAELSWELAALRRHGLGLGRALGGGEEDGRG